MLLCLSGSSKPHTAVAHSLKCLTADLGTEKELYSHFNLIDEIIMKKLFGIGKEE